MKSQRSNLGPMNSWFPCYAWGTVSGCLSARHFGSHHEGGVFFLFADGAVKFLSENMDLTTLRAISTRAGNELLGDGEF